MSAIIAHFVQHKCRPLQVCHHTRRPCAATSRQGVFAWGLQICWMRPLDLSCHPTEPARWLHRTSNVSARECHCARFACNIAEQGRQYSCGKPGRGCLHGASCWGVRAKTIRPWSVLGARHYADLQKCRIIFSKKTHP